MNRGSRMNFPTRGLYILTPDPAPALDELETKIATAIRAGAAVVQYRNKQSNWLKRMEEAEALLSLCRSHGVPLIINDDVKLAEQLKADGVHVGREDDTPQSIRRKLGPHAIVGVSCYGSVARATAATKIGADYIALGSFFRSKTKPNASRCTKKVLKDVAARVSLPIVAIGGITPDNASGLLSCGADLIAVIDGVFAASDVYGATRKYTRLF